MQKSYHAFRKKGWTTRVRSHAKRYAVRDRKVRTKRSIVITNQDGKLQTLDGYAHYLPKLGQTAKNHGDYTE